MTRDEIKAKLKEEAIIRKEEGGLPYLVRGAQLRCTFGSHMRRLNLSPCHGVYVNVHPMVHENNCRPGEGPLLNIPPFGVCSSNLNNVGGNILLVGEGGGDVRGKACVAIFPKGAWCNPHPTMKIADNGHGSEEIHPKKIADNELSAKEMHPDDRTYFRALTTDSFLFCAYKGFVQPQTSGQENIDTQSLNVNYNPQTGLAGEADVEVDIFGPNPNMHARIAEGLLWQDIQNGDLSNDVMRALADLYDISFIQKDNDLAVLRHFLHSLPPDMPLTDRKRGLLSYLKSLQNMINGLYGSGANVRVAGGYLQREGYGAAHQGIDFVVGAGTPVHSLADGTIVSSANGHTVIEVTRPSTGETYYVHYLHMSTADTSWSNGDSVSAGDVLGTESGYCVNGNANRHNTHTHVEVAHSTNSGGNPRESAALEGSAAGRTENPISFFSEFWR